MVIVRENLKVTRVKQNKGVPILVLANIADFFGVFYQLSFRKVPKILTSPPLFLPVLDRLIVISIPGGSCCGQLWV